MTFKLFPINTETSCRLKWAWSSLYLNSGKTASCHRASFSDIDSTNFDNFHNTQEKIAHREVMLNGHWPGHGCEYCQNIEIAGGHSDRHFQNQIPDIYPAELDLNPNITEIDPVIVEVFFSNTCNLKCVYCKASLSSSIQQEDAQFGKSIIPIHSHEHADNRYQELVPKFWSWFEKNSHKLKRLQILGGEPFLQKDVDRIIEYFESTPHPDLEFNLISNLCIPTPLFSKKIKKLANLAQKKHLKRIDILASIDSWGPGQEYVRYGFKRELFETNLIIAQKTEAFKIGLLTTVNSLSINEMPDLCNKFLEWNSYQPLGWYMHLVLPEGTSVFNPLIFGYENFVNSLLQIERLLPTESWDNQRTLEVFKGIRDKLKQQCENNVIDQQKLFDYLDQIDHRRGLNWRDTFQWINKDLYNVVQ